MVDSVLCIVDGFVVYIIGGEIWVVCKLLLVIGICDELFVLFGLVECWGYSVLYCLYCYGYEIGGGVIGLLGGYLMFSMMVGLFVEWGQVILFVYGMMLDEDDVVWLQ